MGAWVLEFKPACPLGCPLTPPSLPLIRASETLLWTQRLWPLFPLGREPELGEKAGPAPRLQPAHRAAGSAQTPDGLQGPGWPAALAGGCPPGHTCGLSAPSGFLELAPVEHRLGMDEQPRCSGMAGSPAWRRCCGHPGGAGLVSPMVSASRAPCGGALDKPQGGGADGLCGCVSDPDGLRLLCVPWTLMWRRKYLSARNPLGETLGCPPPAQNGEKAGPSLESQEQQEQPQEWGLWWVGGDTGPRKRIAERPGEKRVRSPCRLCLFLLGKGSGALRGTSTQSC